MTPLTSIGDMFKTENLVEECFWKFGIIVFLQDVWNRQTSVRRTFSYLLLLIIIPNINICNQSIDRCTGNDLNPTINKYMYIFILANKRNSLRMVNRQHLLYPENSPQTGWNMKPRFVYAYYTYWLKIMLRTT